MSAPGTPLVQKTKARELLAIPVAWVAFRLLLLSCRIGGPYFKQTIIRQMHGLAP